MKFYAYKNQRSLSLEQQDSLYRTVYGASPYTDMEEFGQLLCTAPEEQLRALSSKMDAARLQLCLDLDAAKAAEAPKTQVARGIVALRPMSKVLPLRKLVSAADRLINDLQLDKDQGKRRAKVLRPLLPVLAALQEECRLTGKATNTSDYSYNIFFSVSTRHLAKKLGFSIAQTSYAVNLLAVLGFTTKVADEDLPQDLLVLTEAYRDKLAAKFGADKTIQYFKLIDITTLSAIALVTERLDRWIEAKGKLENVSSDFIAGIYGLEVAMAAYPKKFKKAIEKPAKIA